MNFLTFDSENYEFDFFNDFEGAKKLLLENSEDDDGIPESFCDGRWGIYKKVAKSNFIKTDNREDYCQCDKDQECSCDLEEWSYSDDWSYAGKATVEILDSEIETEKLRARVDELENFIRRLDRWKYTPKGLKHILEKDWK